MLKKHLTILFLLVMAVGAFAQSIPSGTARYEALGYNPFILDAATDINRNPAWSTWYRNYTFVDIGRYPGADEYVLQDQYAGVNFGLGSRQFNIGGVLNKQEGQIWGGSFRDYYSSVGLSAPIAPIELIFGWMNKSKSLSVGIAPYYARWSRDYATSGPGVDTNFDNSTSIMGGTIGVVGKMKNGWWEANVDVRSNKYNGELTLSPDSGTASTVLYENDGGIEINANVRASFIVSKKYKVSVVPYVGFGMFNWDPKVTTSPTATTIPQPQNKWLNIKGGVGFSMPILDQAMLAGGLSFGMTTSEVNGTTEYHEFDTTVTDEKVTIINFPHFNIGGEWSFNEWLTGRLGYSRGVDRVKVEETATITSGGTSTSRTAEGNEGFETNSSHTITVGLGWHFGRFSLDGLIGERFFQQGPYILSGKENDLYGILSASYNFD